MPSHRDLPSDMSDSTNVEEIVLEKGTTGLGFNIRGGIDNHHVDTDAGIFVTTVRVDGAAAKDGRLAPGDKILEIDGCDLQHVTHATAVKKFHETQNKVILRVERGAEQRILKKAEDERKAQQASSTTIKHIRSSPSNTGLLGSVHWQDLLKYGGGTLGVVVICYLGYRKYTTGKFFTEKYF